ncbi:MAG: hypothetical protein GWN58_27595 [Anaerolineae bacterium]|nr:hypothetical protein [Anaerolineae bacterium]
MRIYDLIYPDRYDLLSRAKYARWCRDHRDLWERDELAFLAKAREKTTWGIECDMLTYMWQYWHKGSQWNYPGPHHEAFHADTRKFFTAMASLETNGWLPEGHIQIIWGRKLLCGIDGRHPSKYYRNWFMADAQHRLCVWFGLFGETVFAPEQVEVLDYANYAPFVTTPAYIEVGLLAGLETFKRELDEFMDEIAS